jgi:DNA-directed RNA polymerase subunit RPC12/RpoP
MQQKDKMIFFCEDCGEKNLLGPAQVRERKAVFRCTVCGYPNSYPVKAVKKNYSGKPDTFFQGLKAFPEIIGSFLFHCKNGVLINQMPGILKENDLDTLGKILTESYLTCRTLYQDVTEMAFIISGKNITVKMIDNNMAVIIASRTLPLSQPVMDQLACLVSNNKTDN